jgi:hypothetical protein
MRLHMCEVSYLEMTSKGSEISLVHDTSMANVDLSKDVRNALL